MKRPVLIVLHQENSTPGRVGQELRKRGHALDIRRPRFNDPLPETLDDHAGAVIFGGPPSANDADEYIRREIDWIAVPLKERRPFLGICLGAQMLARQLGARVFPHPEGRAEVGYYPIAPTEAGLQVCAPWPSHVYQWHREGFDLPDGGTLLAAGNDFPVQAFSYDGCGYALQFHMDVTHATMCRWTTRGHARMELPGAQPRDAHFAGKLLHDDACRVWLSSFIDHWLTPHPESARPPAPRREDRPALAINLAETRRLQTSR